MGFVIKMSMRILKNVHRKNRFVMRCPFCYEKYEFCVSPPSIFVACREDLNKRFGVSFRRGGVNIKNICGDKKARVIWFLEKNNVA